MNTVTVREKISRMQAQDFETLRQQCLDSGELFEDPEFPADNTSLYYSLQPRNSLKIIWKRPTELVEKPQFFVKESSRFSIEQGCTSNCWLIGPIVSLTYMHEDIFSQVVPEDQSFDKNYAGIFHFRFWHYGKWIDVVIDDRLPTTENGELYFLNPIKSNEFWSALLEKAYAKLYGTYETFEYGGRSSEAMADFTGGVVENYWIDRKKESLNQFNILLDAFEKNSMICCNTDESLKDKLVENPKLSLEVDHTYTLTHIKYVATLDSKEKIPLLRLRNPYGDEFEWGNPSDDSSHKWRFVPDHEQIESELTFDNDGEFWMTFDNFKHYFSNIDIWNKHLKSLSEDDPNSDEKKWEISLFHGEWVRGVTAGGFSIDKDQEVGTHCYNPQYLITLENPDEGHDTCTVIVALMQKNRRECNEPMSKIGFRIYYLDSPELWVKPLDNDLFLRNNVVAPEPTYSAVREVTDRFELLPGTYCIIPSMIEPNEEGEFLLRIVAKKNINIEENDRSVGIKKFDSRIDEELEGDLDENELRELFQRFADDEEKVDLNRLKEILEVSREEGIQIEGLTEDVCTNMFTVLDTDHSGKLGFDEFKTLWNDVRNWRVAFWLYDSDDSEVLRAFELREVLSSAGYELNNHILNIMGRKYGSKEGKITFDDFIMCAVQLKKMFVYFRQFRDRHPENTDAETFKMMKEWMEDKLFP